MARARLYSHYDRPLWDSISGDGMKLQKCSHCAAFRYPPGPVCQQCLSPDHEWVAIAGKGQLLSWTTFHKQYLPAFPPPHTVVAIALDEGPIMVSHVPAEKAGSLSVGMPMQMIYADHADGYRLPVFTPVEDYPPRCGGDKEGRRKFRR